MVDGNGHHGAQHRVGGCQRLEGRRARRTAQGEYCQREQQGCRNRRNNEHHKAGSSSGARQFGNHEDRSQQWQQPDLKFSAGPSALCMQGRGSALLLTTAFDARCYATDLPYCAEAREISCNFPCCTDGLEYEACNPFIMQAGREGARRPGAVQASAPPAPAGQSAVHHVSLASAG